MRVPYNYLDRQFNAAETEAILDKLRALAATGEFTIGPPVLEFERRFAAMTRVKHVVGTNTGTDALILALKALGIGAGDEVITQVNTFYATVGAIVAVGARPVFVDVDDQYAIDARRIAAAITPRTKAILPVYWTGLPPDMPAIVQMARRHRLYVVEDACPAVGAAYDGTPAGAVFIPFCYYEAAANLLTNPVLDPVGKIPEFKYCAVKVTKGGPTPVHSSFGGGTLLAAAQK